MTLEPVSSASSKLLDQYLLWFAFATCAASLITLAGGSGSCSFSLSAALPVAASCGLAWPQSPARIAGAWWGLYWHTNTYSQQGWKRSIRESAKRGWRQAIGQWWLAGIIDRPMNIPRISFLETQKGFQSPVADSVALYETQKWFHSLQLAANPSFVKASGRAVWVCDDTITYHRP